MSNGKERSEEESLEDISLLERQREAIDNCSEKLDHAIMALWEVRGKYRSSIPALNSYVQTAYTAVATIQIELERYKALISEEAFRDEVHRST